MSARIEVAVSRWPKQDFNEIVGWLRAAYGEMSIESWYLKHENNQWLFSLPEQAYTAMVLRWDSLPSEDDRFQLTANTIRRIMYTYANATG